MNDAPFLSAFSAISEFKRNRMAAFVGILRVGRNLHGHVDDVTGFDFQSGRQASQFDVIKPFDSGL